MKYSVKSKIIVSFFILMFAFLISGCAEKDVPEKEKTYLPEVISLKVEAGLEQEFTVTGEVFAHQISHITASQRGGVDSLFVKEGDEVLEGQNLITLNSSEVISSFNTASSTLRNTQIGLDGTRLSSEKSIKASEIALETAQTNLQNT